MCEIGGTEASAWREDYAIGKSAIACKVCGGIIPPGELHVRHFSVVDWKIYNSRMCASCEADRDEFGDAHELVPTPAWFLEALGSCIAEGDEESEAKWKPMLARIHERGSVAA